MIKKFLSTFIVISIVFCCLTAQAQSWTLATDDTGLTLSISNGQLIITSLTNTTRGWNWITAPTNVSFAVSAKTGSLMSACSWGYVSSTLDTSSGQKLTMLFTNGSPRMSLVSEWWARPGRGPIRNQTTITNVSGLAVTLSNVPSMYLPLTGDGTLNTWYISASGDRPDPVRVSD